MKNLNLGREKGFHHKGNLQPRQTNKQIKREQRMQKRVVNEAVAAQRQQEVSTLETKMYARVSDAALLASCLLIPFKRRRGF